jgi:hypothetical protein
LKPRTLGSMASTITITPPRTTKVAIWETCFFAFGNVAKRNIETILNFFHRSGDYANCLLQTPPFHHFSSRTLPMLSFCPHSVCLTCWYRHTDVPTAVASIQGDFSKPTEKTHALLKTWWTKSQPDYLFDLFIVYLTTVSVAKTIWRWTRQW